MYKKSLVIILLSFVMAIGVGCGEKPPNASNGVHSGGNNNESSSQQEKSEQSLVVRVFYTDVQVEQLVEKEVNIAFTDDLDKYQQAFEALQKSTDPDLVSLWAKIQLQSLSFDNDTLTLDIHIPAEARLGSGGEQFALQALTDTFWQFDEITAIEILVDGEAQESLMGHVELEHPIVRDSGVPSP